MDGRAILSLVSLHLIAWGCAASEDLGWDVPADQPVDVYDAAEVAGDVPDAVDTLRDPDVVDGPSDTWDVPVDEVEEDPPVDTVDAVDVYDPPPDTYDPPPDLPDTTEPPLDVTSECWPTCTDAVSGAAVCPGDRGFRVCPTAPMCWEGCICSTSGTWISCDGICLC